MLLFTGINVFLQESQIIQFAVGVITLSHMIKQIIQFNQQVGLELDPLLIPVFLTPYFASVATVHIKYLMTGLKGNRWLCFSRILTLRGENKRHRKNSRTTTLVVRHSSWMSIDDRRSSFNIFQSQYFSQETQIVCFKKLPLSSVSALLSSEVIDFAMLRA